MTWLDWAIVILIGLFAVRGLIRGTVWQVFGFLGLVAGLFAAGWIARWVGAFWLDARPTVVFLVLKWVVAGLGGLAVASLMSWIGELLGKAVKAGPAGWLDRLGGFAIGATVGSVVAAFTLLVVLLAPLPPDVGDMAVDSKIPAPFMERAASACSVSNAFVPGSAWLKRRFEEAEQRARTRAQDI